MGEGIKNLFEKIKQSNHLPQIPQVMLKLVRLCGNETVNMDELIRLIATEPGLTSKLLQIIGSPYVNLPREVNSIKTAVIYLGLDTVKNIAISSSAMHFFSLAGKIPEFDITRFWYHSYKTAVIAQKIALENADYFPEDFFLAGLLHEVGRLVLMQTFPQAYQSILQKAGSGQEMAHAEMEVLGADTPQVSAWIFNHWNMNPLISDAVLFLNEPIDRVEQEPLHVKTLYMANLLSEPNSQETISSLLSLTDIHETRVEEIAAQAEDEVAHMARSLGISLQENRDKAVEQEIALEMKDLSLFYGTIQNLLNARDIPHVLESVQRGLKIIFNVPRVFFFLLDEKKNLLIGDCSREDKNHRIVRRIAIPLSNGESRFVRSLKTSTIWTSFQSNGEVKPAISDTRIILLLETRGVYCLPITCQGKSLGVMALGVDEVLAESLNTSRGLVALFSRQTGVCLQNLLFHQKYASDIHEKKMEAYYTLTHKVIHEINNPIAIIKNYMENLKMKLPDKHPVQEELSVVGEEISRVSLLMEGLSSFSKPRIGGFESVDINALCTGIIEILKKAILLPRQIEATLRTDPKIPHIKTDKNGLKQVLINLIKNAAEAMEGGGKIDIQTRFQPGSSKILIDEQKQLPGSVEIHIRDNGPGMKPEIMDRLFEPYNSTKTGKNSGLGLSIVHSIVKELKGRITCDSKQGLGTCFAVYLPAPLTRPSAKA